jgi:hypothetical protein
MVQLEIYASDSHELFTTLLRLDASFIMTPRAVSKSIPNSNRVLTPKPKNCMSVVLRPKPSNPTGQVYLLCLLHSLDACHLPSSSIVLSPRPLVPPLDLVNRHFDLVNTVYSFAYTLAYQCPQVSATRNQSLLATLVPQSKPHVHPSPLSVHQHGTSLFPSPWPSTVSLCSTPTHTTQLRDMLPPHSH